MRERFISGHIDLSALPPDQLDEISSQLSSIKDDYSNRQQMRIEKKDDMKKRGLPSPDMGDAAAIGFGRLRGNIQYFSMPMPTPATPAQQVSGMPPAPLPTPAPPMAEDERHRLEREADLLAIKSQRGW